MSMRLLCLSVCMFFTQVVMPMDRRVLEPEDTLLQKHRAGQNFWMDQENKKRVKIKQKEKALFDQLQKEYVKVFAAVLVPVCDIKPRSKKSVRLDARQAALADVQWYIDWKSLKNR